MSHPAGYLDPVSTRAYRLARRRSTTFTEIAVVDDLERCHRKYGRPTPSVVDIARAVGRSTRSVIRATRALAARGHLHVVQDRPVKLRDGTFTRHRTNLYVIRFPDSPQRVVPGGTDVTSMAPLLRKSRTGAPSRGAPVGNSRPYGPPPDAIQPRMCPDGCTVCDDTGWEGRDPGNGRCLA